MSEIIRFLEAHNVRRVLDLACGSGRHTVYLAQHGFEVNGIDVSEEGIKRAKSSLEASGLSADLLVGSMHEVLPYEDSFFDAVVCTRSLNHGTIEEIRGTIREIRRVLQPKGLVYVTVRKRVSKEMRLPFEVIAPRTYIPLEGEEKGVVHYLFNKELLRKEFREFIIRRFRVEYGPKAWEAYYCLLGELKSRGP